MPRFNAFADAARRASIAAAAAMALLASGSCAVESTPANPTPVASGFTSVLVTGTVPSVGGPPQQFVATAFRPNQTSDVVTYKATWQSSAPAVASVSADSGLVTALNSGTVDITASYQGVAGTMHVVISALKLEGRVTDERLDAGVGGVTIRGVDPEHATVFAITDASGLYGFSGFAPGTMTLSASGQGFAPVQKTTTAASNTRVDFVMPRRGSSPAPDIAGAWAGVWHGTGGAAAVEFSLTQNGASVNGTWRIPYNGVHGTISGAIGADRWLSGHMTYVSADGRCGTDGDIYYGDLSATERYLNIGADFGFGCSASYTSFELDRTCRVNGTGLSCDPR